MWIIPPDTGTLSPLAYAWRTVPCRGESLNGDGLAMEEDRRDTNVQFLLLDGVDHGPRAFSFVELVRFQLKAADLADLAPGKLLTILHSRLAPVWAATGSYVAALSVLVNGETGKLTGAFAGIPWPMIRRADGSFIVWTSEPGFPVGLGIPDEDSFEYPQAEEQLNSSDAVLFCTDGVTETSPPDSRSELLRASGVVNLWGRLPAVLTPADLANSLLQELSRIADSKWPQDDTTILILFQNSRTT